MQELSPYFINRTSSEVTPNFSTSATGFAQEEPSVREYWRIITKRWRFIASLVTCALALTGAVAFLMTPTYTARSSVLIEPQAPQLLDMKQLESQQSGESAEQTYYGTQYKILESRSLAARVIRELDLQKQAFLRPKHVRAPKVAYHAQMAGSKDLRDPVAQDQDPEAGTLGIQPGFIDEYLKDLTIRPEPGTRLVTVAFGSPDPVLSARVVNAHIQAYIARGTELHAEASQSAVKYLQTKLTELQAKVEKSEAALNEYRRERGIVTSSSGGTNKVVMDRLIDLNKALTEAETQRITLDAEDHLISTRHYDALPAVTDDKLIQDLRQQEARIQAEYASLAAEYRPNYPPLAELAAKLKEAQARVNQEIRRVATGIHLSYDAALQREKELNDKIEHEKTRALALNDASLQDAILSRAVDTNRKLYKNVLERMTELGMAAGATASNVSVLDSAAPPLLPSSPKTLLMLASCGAFALLLGVSIACILERCDDTFKDSDEIEPYVGIPNLTIVPDFRKLTHANAGPKTTLLSRLTPAKLRAKEAVVMVDEHNGFSAATEAYRALRLGLLLSKAGEPPKVILITSGTPGEGKTVTAINTAIAFAQMGSRVLLVDGDLRNPRCHTLLALPNHEGLAEILTGQRPASHVIRETGIDTLACLTSGSAPPNPGRLLGSHTMSDLLLDLKGSYDCIIIDSAPVMPVTDTLHLVNMVDGVLLVVGPHIPKRRVRHVCSRLNQMHAPLLGIVQNQVDISTHRSAGDYYYPHFQPSQDINEAGSLAGS
jgi:polysaccharide biosynthesis transport protein